MKIRPLHDRVIVRRLDEEKKTASGIVIPDTAAEKPGQGVANSGAEPSVVLNKVLEGKDDYGYNAQTAEFGDLVQMGVIDPTKVVRFALQNAASVAGLVPTTAAMVAARVEGEADSAAPHASGGMEM